MSVLENLLYSNLDISRHFFKSTLVNKNHLILKEISESKLIQIKAPN